MNPKVFIGIITAEAKSYAEDLFFMHLIQNRYQPSEVLIVDNTDRGDWSYVSQLRKYGFQIMHIEPFSDLRKTLVESRNILRKYFLDTDCEYFFSLESDVLLEKETIPLLLERNKEIVSGIYCFSSGAPIAYDYSYWSDDMRQRIRTTVCRDGKLLPIKIAGLGCLLIKREVIEKIKFRYEETASGTDDVWFSMDAHDCGYEVYLDTNVRCKHYGNYLGIKEVIEFK